MVTARSFAARNRYEIDVDREFIALGACNIAAGLSQGFAVTGADSRTAVSDAMGGKTQVTGLVAAAAMAIVLLFLTDTLRFLPGSALGAVLISAGIGLFDWKALVRFYRIQEGEFVVCVAAMLGVVTLGALQGIALSIALAMLVLVIRSSRPADAVLGRVEGLQGFHDVALHEGATTVPGLVLYRFMASVIFYNAPYFKRRVLAVAEANPAATWMIIDGAPILHLDSTGADTIVALSDELAARGIGLAFAGLVPQAQRMLERSGAFERLGGGNVFRDAAARRHGARVVVGGRDETPMKARAVASGPSASIFCPSLALRLATSACRRARLMLPIGAVSGVEFSVTSMCHASQAAGGSCEFGVNVSRATV